MKLILIRHATAVDAQEWAAEGGEESARPLTAKGKRRFSRIAPVLQRLIGKVDILASSPYKRAAQTAQLIAGDENAHIIERPELTPERRPAMLLGWLLSIEDGSTVVVVGHEPHLSQSIGWLTSGLQESQIEMKKGAACMIEFRGDPGPGKGKLAWMITPQVLRRLRKPAGKP